MIIVLFLSLTKNLSFGEIERCEKCQLLVSNRTTELFSTHKWKCTVKSQWQCKK